MSVPLSDEDRFHSIQSAFEEEPQISEKTADIICLVAEAFLFAVCVVVILLAVGVLR